MRKPVGLHLRALQSPRNGRPARRIGAARASIHPTTGRPWTRLLNGLRRFRGIGRAIGEIFGMAVVLALSIVLAHALLIVMFPV